jgi:hypothetical protein
MLGCCSCFALVREIPNGETLATDINRDSMIRFPGNRPIDFRRGLYVSPLPFARFKKARGFTRHLKMA